MGGCGGLCPPQPAPAGHAGWQDGVQGKQQHSKGHSESVE